ncbi:NAD(P)-dependent oxidoreductase [Lactobacillus selangorensis]|nr:NAD(P)H-binding protein [Lactobacillus selangorensis]
MKIMIIGATGMAGSAVTAEAARRGHEVTAIARSQQHLAQLQNEFPTIHVLAKDAFDLTTDDLAGAQVIVDAFAAGPSEAGQHVDLAKKLVKMYADTTTPRLFFILGAGSLKTGDDKHLFVDDIAQDPKSDAFIAIPKAQLEELHYLQGVKDVNWVGVSPSADFHKGVETDYTTGTDELLVSPDGHSVTTSGTMGVAILNEIEKPQHHQARFTVADRDQD